MTRAASFDIWLTLLRSNPHFKSGRNALLGRALAPRTAVDEFAHALRTADVEADRRAETTGRNLDLADRLRLTLGHLGVPDTALDPGTVDDVRREQHELAQEYPPVLAHPSLPGLLDELSAHIPLAITSNTGMLPAATMRTLLDQVDLGRQFTVLTFSDEVGYAKPDRRIFHATLASLALPPASARRTVHVGDNPHADIRGATAVGMRPILVGPGAPIEDAVAALLASVDGKCSA